MNSANSQFESEEVAAKTRGKDRDSLFLTAILRFPTTKEEGEVRVRNLSEGGLMAVAPVKVSMGDPVEINLRSIGWVGGHVVWATEGRIGIAFDHPIDPKAARNPVGTAELDLPPHLKKLNQPGQINKYRRF